MKSRILVCYAALFCVCVVLICAYFLSSPQTSLEIHQPLPIDEKRRSAIEIKKQEAASAAVQSTDQNISSVRKTITAASLTLSFRSSSDRLPVSGVLVGLLQEFESKLVACKKSDAEGRIHFSNLMNGMYRWTLMSHHNVTLVPPYEEEAESVTKRGIRVRNVPRNLSGQFTITKEEQKEILIEVRPGATVRGTLAFQGQSIESPAFVKLLTRRKVDDGQLTVVNRVHARKAKRAERGEFCFNNVTAGDMELQASWLDHAGVCWFLRRPFQLQPGEQRDLGFLAFPESNVAHVLIRCVDQDGQELSLRSGDRRRKYLVEPAKPDPHWPYMPHEFDIGESIRVGGVYPGSWKLTRLSEFSPEFQQNWLRVTDGELEFQGGDASPQTLTEIFAKKVPVDVEFLLPVSDREFKLRIHAIRRYGYHVVEETLTGVIAEGRVSLKLAAGQYDLFCTALGLDGNSVLSGHLELSVDAEKMRQVQVALEVGAVMRGIATVGKGRSAAGIQASPVALAKRGIWIYRTACSPDGRFSLPVHAGSIQVKGHRKIWNCGVGETVDLKEVRLSR